MDYIEEYDGQLHTYEFKWNSGKTAKLPLTFSNAYPGSAFMLISPENYLDFLG